ncbi:hypothetical protein PHMEG_00030557 [Phytophthora megakarya]|uniref:Uncharacterized protein n=1 Tax=Phytophthora megakarya TaxID=4795 RepID=A0A225V024_9STRA|nr:hypothetical protein PHMEG_00030557 [Phytophthora megakarya]
MTARKIDVNMGITTLEGQDLAERLTLLRVTDVDNLEEVIRARDRAKNRQKKAVFGSGKYRQKIIHTTPLFQRNKCVQSRSKRTTESDSDIDSHRRTFLAANEAVTPKSRRTGIHDFWTVIMSIMIATRRSTVMVLNVINARTVDQRSTQILVVGGVLHEVRQERTSLGSLPLRVSWMWKLHDIGKCPMEEFYNQIGQWLNPTKHMGMLPKAAEKMLN